MNYWNFQLEFSGCMSSSCIITYRLDDFVLSGRKTHTKQKAMGVEYLQMSFQNHLHFRTERLVQFSCWHCLQCLNGLSRYTSPHKIMIAKIPGHASFPTDFPWNHLDHVQRFQYDWRNIDVHWRDQGRTCFFLTFYLKKIRKWNNITSPYIRLSVSLNGTEGRSLRAFQCQ